MDQLAGLTIGRHEVVPAPRDEHVRVQTEDAVGDRIAMVVVIEQPDVELGFAQGGLEAVELHAPMLTARTDMPAAFPLANGRVREP